MSQNFIIHWQPEIPQFIIGQEASNGQMQILNVIKGHESLELIDILMGRSHYDSRGRIKKA